MKRYLQQWIPVGVLLGAYLVLSLSGSARKSATWDETHYLGLGNYLWSHGNWDIPSAMLHPPLSYYLAALPLGLCELRSGCFEPGPPSDIVSGARRGQCLLRNSRPSGDHLLFLARVPTVILGLVLGCFIYLWGSRLYGRGGGLVSLFLYCVSPNILAHSGLLTPDLCFTTFCFMTVFFFWWIVQAPSFGMIVLCGIALGLTLLSKYAGLILVPVLTLLALASGGRPAIASSNFSQTIAAVRPIVLLGMVVAVAFLVLFLGYGFRITPYLTGMEMQKEIIGEGLPAFMNGRVSKHGGWWTYYLFAFAVKVPIPFLLVLAAAVFTGRGVTSSPSPGVLWLLIPVLVIFAAFSSLTRVNVGFRYVLPVLPFLMVLGGRVALLWRGKKAVFGLVAAPLMIWTLVESFFIYPHYLAYFNQIAGGPGNGYRYLVDSNLDWGQDLKGLKAYMDERGMGTIHLSYFGSADPGQYAIDYKALPSFLPLSAGCAPAPLRKGDLVAVSATNLYPLYVDLGELSAYLRSISPVAHVGHSILIYRLGRDF
ncbi:MAG: glycosyltransferase family 39 protein [Deltaproteobacteria bacterium]|nr:glycosyltransferase family 39 protein [Deltaproteobacteria bacterium]